MQFLGFNQLKGSSANLPAHWAGWARAKNLAAHFAEQNTNPVGAARRAERRGNALAKRLGGARRRQLKSRSIFRKSDCGGDGGNRTRVRKSSSILFLQA